MDIFTKAQQKFCDNHKKKLDYYCFQAQHHMPLCIECFDTHHNGHNFKELIEFKDQEKKKYSNIWMTWRGGNVIEFKESIYNISEQVKYSHIDGWSFVSPIQRCVKAGEMGTDQKNSQLQGLLQV